MSFTSNRKKSFLFTFLQNVSINIMGFSHKSHGKRSDKETQSPMLKIFKDMVMKDKRDPEKTNLLKEKHPERKRKHYSGSRSKSGHKTVSSSSDHPKKEQPYRRVEKDNLHAAFDESERSTPFQGEKRESWWFWGGEAAEGSKSKAEDTCSCVSCALKKLISTDYACIACITILLVVSVLVAVLLVYKSIPCSFKSERSSADKVSYPKADSERLKRKISELAKWNIGPKKDWRHIFLNHDDADMGSFNFQGNDLASLVESQNELSKILDTDKMTDIQHSDRLRDFYKKLVQTDAAIRNLRKSLNENSYVNTHNFDFSKSLDYNNNNYDNNYNIDSDADINNNVDIYPDRSKRSIKLYPSRFFNFKRREPATLSKIDNGKLITKSTINMTANKKPTTKGTRNKRFGNITDGSFVIEKNKVVIQYRPNRIVPKCSHAPKDSKSHETQLTHPFYKNTQRLDEFLDQIMGKKIPEILTDRMELGVLLNKDKQIERPINEELILVKDEDILKDYEQEQKDQAKDQRDEDNTKSETEKNMIENYKIEETTHSNYGTANETPKVAKYKKEASNAFENDFFEDSDGVEKKIERSTTDKYDILLSISTLVNPSGKKATLSPVTNFPDRPNMRKLQQADVKEEESVAYEDVKEVLSDYKEGHDDEDKESDRKKRNFQDDVQVKIDPINTTPISINNPNWKGPMPLYPEELSEMIKQNTSPDTKIPLHSRDSPSEADDNKPRVSDVEYVEDYLDNGYEKLVELAQAYSDYGVLNVKKETNAEKKAGDKEPQKIDKKSVGLSLRKLRNSFKSGIKKNAFLEKLHHKGRDASEGIRFEIQPNPKCAELPEGDVFNLKDMLQKHVKIVNNHKHLEQHQQITHGPETATTRLYEFHAPTTDKIKTTKTLDPMPDIIYKKRTLKTLAKSYATDKMENKVFNSDINRYRDINNDENINKHKIVEYKHSDAAPEDTLRIEQDRNRKEINNEGNFVENAFSHYGPDLKFQFKRDTYKGEEVNIDDIKNSSFGGPTNTNQNKRKESTKESSSSLSSFFMRLSNWFSALDEKELASKNASRVTPSDKKAIIRSPSNQSETTESQMTYPSYNSDMVGHKSRALLSVDSSNNTENQNSNVPPSTETINSNITREIKDTTDSAKNDELISNETDNRIVKRQAIDDSNLIFWNDLYDEEYGINADPIENNIRDKHSVDRKDFIKKSNTWIQDKVRKIADRFYFTDSKKGAKDKNQDASKHVKRSIKYGDDDEENGSKLNLASLTERMKEICKETAKAVQETKHIQVREENKQGHAASTLMQQLVRLMTDLVDFQVQERTCRKLPADLQHFLDWLTSTKDDDTETDTYYSDKNLDHDGMNTGNKMDKPTEQDLLQPSERENTDSKTDCLGTLHAVQNLIREYEEMSEDDKSLMTGVKSYLENQMHYLQQQLSSLEDKQFNQNRYKRDLIIDVGHSVAQSVDATARTLDKEYKKLKKFYNKYKGRAGHAYKQALKTTAEIKTAVTEIGKKICPTTAKPKTKKKKYKHTKVLKINDKTKAQMEKEKSHKAHKEHKDQMESKHKTLFSSFHFRNKVQQKNKEKENFEDEDDINYLRSKDSCVDGDKNERNIQDVYFKAVEEAKKATVTKDSHVHDGEVFDKTDIYRINDYVGEKGQ